MSKLKYYKNGQWYDVGGNIAGDTLPIGAIVPFGGWDAPTGWLICDGTLLNKTDYPELFNAIGYSFGGEEGGSTFGLPDLRGRVPLGLKETDTDFNGMGLTGGSKYLQQHNHMERTYSANYGGGVTIPEYRAYARSYTGDDSQPGAWRYTGGSARTNCEISQMIETENTGTGNSGNLQPYQTVNYIIKAKQSAGVVANVSNTYSTSQNDTYSCEYVNGIIESGSNANGEYVKYADGTMICTGAKFGNTTWEDWWSFCKRSPEGSNMLFASFPQAFINGNARVSITTSHGNAVFSASYNSVQTDGFYFICYKPSSNTSTNYGIQYIAIGKWK